jgi:hypothetical protein
VKESNQGQYDRTYWLAQAMDELSAAQAQGDRARRGIVGAAIIGDGTYGLGGY